MLYIDVYCCLVGFRWWFLFLVIVVYFCSRLVVGVFVV